jgi:hypothetical protein
LAETRNIAGATMPKLKIRFKGLCLFVPDRGAKIMHVLMPDASKPHLGGSSQHGGGAGDQHRHESPPVSEGNTHEPHVILLRYDTGYESNLNRLFGTFTTRQFQQVDLNLLGRFPGTLEPRVPAQVANVSNPGKAGRVNPDLIRLGQHPLIGARVRLNAGNPVNPGGGACWTYGKTDQYLAFSLDWELVMPDPTLDPIWLPRMDNLGEGRVPRLFPVNDEIVIEILNLPPAETMPDRPAPRPPSSQEPEHFHMYAPLFQRQHGGTIQPPRNPRPCRPPQSPAHADDDPALRLDSYTCMLGGGCLPGDPDCD